MKKLIMAIFTVVASTSCLNAQVVGAVNRAGFGVDGELRSSFLGTKKELAKNSHDWFANTPPDPLYGVPVWIIDTTGAAFITGKYLTDPNFRRLPFFRVMKYDQLSVVDGKRLIDAVYIRDYHGIDSTVFATSNKNGDNPSDWQAATESNVPDKNDILDTYVHVRRQGPNQTLADSLWFIGGIALDATNGNRYFDFEMYQTDIFFDRSTLSFTGFGPDEGHTSWKFDPATSVVTIPGDVIFTAEFGGGGLQNLQARIWVHQSALSLNSPNFDWAGDFDGHGGSYGYASIKPKDPTQWYYTGMQNPTTTWAGPFQLVRANNTVQSNFDVNQFLEFSVNMTRLGLDPISLLGGDACGLPFRRILIKTRSSSSFTAELKDFIGPFDFFNFSAVGADADVPFICGESISTITVTNPMPTSTYSWITPDGNIISDTSGPEITVDAPGTYIVRQQLLTGCGQFASDTVVIVAANDCGILPANKLKLNGTLEGENVDLHFEVTANENVSYYVLERSSDGVNYQQHKIINNNGVEGGTATYLIGDNISTLSGTKVYYRVKLVRIDQSVRYSPEVELKRMQLNEGELRIVPNPVVEKMQLVFVNSENEEAVIKIFNAVGALMEIKKVQLTKGNNVISIDGLGKLSSGVYPIQVQTGNSTLTSKMIITRKK